MKSLLSGICLVLALSICHVHAGEFLGAPVMDGGEIIKKTDGHLEQIFNCNSEQIVDFYKSAFKNERDVSFRLSGERVDIEDFDAKQWHTIIISPIDDHRTRVVVMRDHWIWTVKNLILPFCGVFFVLFVLYVATSICGALFTRRSRLG